VERVCRIRANSLASACDDGSNALSKDEFNDQRVALTGQKPGVADSPQV